MRAKGKGKASWGENGKRERDNTRLRARISLGIQTARAHARHETISRLGDLAVSPPSTSDEPSLLSPNWGSVVLQARPSRFLSPPCEEFLEIGNDPRVKTWLSAMELDIRDAQLVQPAATTYHTIDLPQRGIGMRSILIN